MHIVKCLIFGHVLNVHTGHFSPDLIVDGYFIDFDEGMLHLMMPLSNKGGGELWMVLDISEIKQLWRDILLDILPMIDFLLIIAIVVVLFLSRSINRPLAQMTQMVKAIESNSDLSQRLNDSNVLELNHLAGAFNSMLHKFQGIIAEAGKVSVSTTEAAEKMAHIAEQGRGFVVLADEVRTLANQTQESTNKVQTMINDLQSASQAHELGKSLEQSSEKLEMIVGQFKV